MSAHKEGRYPALDGMRALASFAVIFTHVGYITGRSLDNDLIGALLGRGNFGVTVFFLLSGFLLYRPFAAYSFGVGRKPAIGAYLWRRAFRIFPALWVAVTFTLVLLSTGFTWPNWASYVLLVQTYNHNDYNPNLGQLWTLVVEISFYALLPILAKIVGGPKRGPDAVLRRQMGVIVAMIVITLVFNGACFNGTIGDQQAVLWLPNYLDWFAGGMMLAVLTVVPAETRVLRAARASLQAWGNSLGSCWVLAAVLMGLCLTPLAMPRSLGLGLYWQWTAEHYLFLACAFFLLLPLVVGGRGAVSTVLGTRFAGVLGSISYSVYLWHPQLMRWWSRTLDITPFTGHFPLMLLLTFTSSVLVATASWYLLEKPIMDHSSRWLRRRTSVAAAPIASPAMQSS